MYGRGGMCGRGTSMTCMPPPVHRMTDACKNITLPQTSFAGGKKQFIRSSTIAPSLNEF